MTDQLRYVAIAIWLVVLILHVVRHAHYKQARGARVGALQFVFRRGALSGALMVVSGTIPIRLFGASSIYLVAVVVLALIAAAGFSIRLGDELFGHPSEAEGGV